MNSTVRIASLAVLCAGCARLSPVHTAPAATVAPVSAPIVRQDTMPTIDVAPANARPDTAPRDSVARDTATRVVQQGAPVSAAATSSDTVALAAEVTARAEQLFGDTLPTHVAVDSAVAPSWDIDVHSYEARARVARYVQIFTTTAKDHIQARLDRGTRFEPMIRAKLRAGGLPEDMYYLALIESGFDENAYSRAAAVGMWQFMTSTARDMGLRVDWWIDERRDPVKSTDAAVRFIRDLDDQFGSLYLAAAAYNGGPGRITRGLSRYADDLDGTTGDDLFFALADHDAFRHETRDYVPQLIAAALVAKEPARYGLSITREPPFEYDSARVAGGTPLAAIAAAANTSVASIQELNPQVLRGITPPHDSTKIRLPRGAGDTFLAALADLSDSARTGLRAVESKKGESVYTIAHAHHLTTAQLAMYNPKLERLPSGNLAAGQRVLVPTPAVVAAAVHVPDPAIERFGSSSSGRSATHVVKSGETLSGIAKSYHTTVSALMKANGLKRALIFPGQSLVVRAGAGSTRQLASASGTASKVASSKPVKSVKSSRPAATTTLAKKVATKDTTKGAKHATKTIAKAPTKKVGAGKPGAHH